MRQDLTARQRDDLILKLRMRGWPLRRIAKAVQMSPSGVAHALERMVYRTAWQGQESGAARDRGAPAAFHAAAGA